MFPLLFRTLTCHNILLPLHWPIPCTFLPNGTPLWPRTLDACLTFFSFPEEEWISLRTSNVIERLNKEFKRRTKPMEIVAGRDRLLSSPGVHITEDGDELEDNKNREGMSEFAPLQEIYTIGLTVPP